MVFAVLNVTRFLCENSLPFRSSDESDILGDGLFLRAFSLLIFPIEPGWKRTHQLIPDNAKYTSSTMQNELISVLAELVREKIAARVCSVQGVSRRWPASLRCLSLQA